MSQNPDEGSDWYKRFFHGKPHEIFIGHDADDDPLVITIVKEVAYSEATSAAGGSNLNVTF